MSEEGTSNELATPELLADSLDSVSGLGQMSHQSYQLTTTIDLNKEDVRTTSNGLLDIYSELLEQHAESLQHITDIGSGALADIENRANTYQNLITEHSNVQKQQLISAFNSQQNTVNQVSAQAGTDIQNAKIRRKEKLRVKRKRQCEEILE